MRRFVHISLRLAPFVVAALALVVVFRCGYKYPYSDDWDLAVPALDGEQRITLSWLWAQHNEHRLPIPKLVLIASDALFHGDFRGAVLVNWLMLVAIVVILLAALRRSTQRVPPWSALLITSIALGASNNALRWGVENQFVLSAILMTAASCAILFAPSAATIIVAGLSATLLPLTGGNGVLFSVGAVAALMLCALRARPARLKIVALVFLILSIAATALYFRGYASPTHHEGLRTQSLPAVIAMCGHLIVAPFGPYGSRWMSVSAPLALVCIAISFVKLWRAYRSDASQWPIAAAIGCVTLGTALVIGAIAIARGARGWPAGLETHYATLAIPFWGMLALGLVAIRANGLAIALTASACLCFVTAFPSGPPPPYVHLGEQFHDAWCRGEPPEALARQYVGLFYYVDTPQSRNAVARHLSILRNAPLAAWRCARPDASN